MSLEDFFTCDGIRTTKESRGEGRIGRMWRWLWSRALLSLHRRQKHRSTEAQWRLIRYGWKQRQNKWHRNGRWIKKWVKQRLTSQSPLQRMWCCLWPPIPFWSLLGSGNSKSGSESRCVWDSHSYSTSTFHLHLSLQQTEVNSTAKPDDFYRYILLAPLCQQCCLFMPKRQSSLNPPLLPEAMWVDWTTLSWLLRWFPWLSSWSPSLSTRAVWY